jgi:hypothetical protein
MRMIGTESLIDCLYTSFGRIRSRRSSRMRPIHKVIQMIKTESVLDCLRTSFGRIRSRRSSRMRPIHKVIQMIKTESVLDYLRTFFGRIRSRHSSRKLEDIWSTNVMMETSDQVCMVISKWTYSREIFKMSWIFLLKLCGVETFLCNVVFLLVSRKIIFSFFKWAKGSPFE